MKHTIVKILAVVLVLAMTAVVFIACGDEKNGSDNTTTTAAALQNGTNPKITGIEDLYGDMTPAEISQFYQDLEDLGYTTDDILEMLGVEVEE